MTEHEQRIADIAALRSHVKAEVRRLTGNGPFISGSTNAHLRESASEFVRALDDCEQSLIDNPPWVERV